MRRTSTDVIRDVSERWHVPVAMIVGPSRAQRVYAARKAVIAELDRMGWSCSRIGRRLGRHHTTIMYSLGRLGK